MDYLRNIVVLLSLFTIFPITACATSPKCDGIENWPASMAFVYLKNENLITNEQIDFAKSNVNLLASQKTTDDTYVQIHRVEFLKFDGSKIIVITENIASKQECSEGPVKAYLIDRVLGA